MGVLDPVDAAHGSTREARGVREFCGKRVDDREVRAERAQKTNLPDELFAQEGGARDGESA